MGWGAGNFAKSADGGGATRGNGGILGSLGAAAGTGSAAGMYNCVAVYRGRSGSMDERTWSTNSRMPRWIATLATSEVDLDRGAGSVP